jgi:MSHA biogenesis protein MshN
MSLINKMLQDLDARGTPAQGPMQGHIKPVARESQRVSLPVVAAAIGGAVAIAAAGTFGWRYLNKPVPKAATPQRAAVIVQAPPAAMPAPVAPSRAPLAAAPLPEPAPEPASAVGAAPQAGAPAEVAPHKKSRAAEAAQPEEPGEAAPHKKTRKERREEKARLAAEKKARAAEERKARAQEPAPAQEASAPKSKKSRQATVAAGAEPAPKKSRAAPAVEGREETAGQRAEGAYRGALASLQEGRVNEAIAALQKALQVDPRHDAARQTLVGLLIENRRSDEAIRQLQLGLTFDARQPALAMLLARLQIERGESGIETLTRTLPYAAGNAEYQALLAGALQRQQRHREAAEQYQAALRTQPHNAVWWMGLGISLLAEKRNAEAQDAFQKAKASGTLSPELQAFVERKLGQLGR